MGKPNTVDRSPAQGMRLAGAGAELAATVGVACLLGYWIDRAFATEPWGLIVLALIGVVGGVYNLIRHAVHEALQTRDKALPRGDLGDDEHSSDKNR